MNSNKLNQQLFCRNEGFISQDIQERIASTRILIAGCGLGSMIATHLARLGFSNFTLVDRDTVEPHNLNRQAFEFEDIGKSKVACLGRRLKAINPNAKVNELHLWVDQTNAAYLCNENDVIIDTIDFLNLPAIVALHSAAHLSQKPVFSALAMGWGAGCLYFDAKTPFTFLDLLGIKEVPKETSHAGYVEYLKPLFGRLASGINPQVAQVMGRVFQFMEDGRPCPASQLAVGSFMAGALCGTMLVKYLKGESLTHAPEMVVVDLEQNVTGVGIKIAA